LLVPVPERKPRPGTQALVAQADDLATELLADEAELEHVAEPVLGCDVRRGRQVQVREPGHAAEANTAGVISVRG
jgi:hypothetical protein